MYFGKKRMYVCIYVHMRGRCTILFKLKRSRDVNDTVQGYSKQL